MGTALLAGNNRMWAEQLAPAPVRQTKLPRWRGFNLLDFFSARHYRKPVPGYPGVSTEDDFKWMRDWGFDYVRIPLAYPCYIHFNPDNDRDMRIRPDQVCDFNEEAVDAIEELIRRALKYDLHVSLNLHRAPGFCINAGFYEPYNLWQDEEAQLVFYAHWEMWSKRLKHISSAKLSFDLVNEPSYREDMNDQFSASGPIPGDIYRKIAERCLGVIHSVSPDRLVIADGNSGGHLAVPELVGLNLAQSCRGYFPHTVSHYRAPWVWQNPDDSPTVAWPGTIAGETYNRQVLEEFFQPWFDLIEQGVGVHCGECGCYRETPHAVFISWFSDMLDMFTSHNIGYALWNFRGDFGILDSGRKDVEYEEWHGHKLDRKMLNMLQKY